MVKLTNEDLKCITLFEQLTGASVVDCLVEPGSAVFIVREGDMGRAIGKSGSAIERVRKAFNRNISVVEHSDKMDRFIANLFPSIPIRDIKVREEGGTRMATISVDAKDRGNAIGRNGEHIKLAKKLLMRHFDTDLKLFSPLSL
ncbi:MAG: NusA-like transcription termination signal-binding factor [Candidatus Micrarchaeota archaeon]